MDYQEIYARYMAAKNRYQRALPGGQEYEAAKREVSEAGHRLWIAARKLGIEPLGGPKTPIAA
jgi:hypothetical protein